MAVLIGTKDKDILVGTAADDWIEGLGGGDWLNGGGGNDTLIGGPGNDVYVIDTAGDQVIEAPGEGIDRIESWFSVALAVNVENLMLVGSAALNGSGNSGDNTLLGNALNNLLFGQAGDDQLWGEGGSDEMHGGAGNDTYVVDNAADQTIELPGQGIDLVQASIRWSLGSGLENLTLGGTAAIDGTGNGLDNVLTGNIASNVLYGFGGNDDIRGGAGNDRLDGGAGTDILSGSTGNDTYVVDNIADAAREHAGQGTDRVLSLVSYTLGDQVENLTLLNGGGAIDATGSRADNLMSGNAFANRLWGQGGSDTLMGHDGDDWLNGGAGQDTLCGGSGRDRFVFDSAGDSLSAAGQSDRIVDFRPGIDVIDLSGIDAFTGSRLGNQAFLYFGESYFACPNAISFKDTPSGQTLICCDTNGDYVPEVQIVLAGNLAERLSVSDFVL